MPSIINRISVESAFALVEKEIKGKPREHVKIEDASGRILAEDIIAEEDIPKWSISEVDGYAVNTDSSANKFEMIGKSGPGERFSGNVMPGQCIRILTGSFLPNGVDYVIPQEDVTLSNNLVIMNKFDKNKLYFMQKGYEFKAGETIAGSGSKLTPQLITFLKYLRKENLEVYPAIKVGLFSVGSELIDNSLDWVEGKVINSNHIALVGLMNNMGLEVKSLGILRDDINEIKLAILKASSEFDIVVTTGGSSVGDTDLIYDSLVELNSKYLFHGLKLKPGRTAGVAILQDKPVVSISGNIQAAVIEIIILVGGIAKIISGSELPIKKITASLDRHVKINSSPGYKSVMWLKLYQIGNRVFASPLESRSPMKSIIMRADGFTVLDVDELNKNDEMEVTLL